ncbi:hypothetical protein L7F22_019492 [Adiantum nelumboides]|nr:hypothetical protein [Adiantum nelumboides]
MMSACSSTARQLWRSSFPIQCSRSVKQRCFTAYPARGYSSSSSPNASSSNASIKANRAGWAFAGSALLVAGLLSTRFIQDRKLSCEAKLPNPEPKSLPDISKLDSSVIEDPNSSMRIRMETYVKLLQRRIVEALSKEEPKAKFFVDSWLRKEGGEGISCVMQDGQTFEKAGVNISIVHGLLPPRAIAQMSADHSGLLDVVGYKLGLKPGEKADVQGLPFFATGLSLVVHPRNPFAPTVHFNYRYFELTHPPKLQDGSPNPKYDPSNPNKPAAWWFGGGTDLTPIYLFDGDATHFHNTLKQAADAHDRHFYPVWKAWCDSYFLIPHRNESRGIGGIFFDDLNTTSVTPQQVELSHGNAKNPSALPQMTELPHTRESLFASVRALGDAFLPAYLPILQVRKRMPFTEEDEEWQAIRRGRYVEFNLVYDRGTKFGLQTPGARIESILMSLPLRASWIYGHPVSGMQKPEEGKVEEWQTEGKKEAEQARLMEILRSPKEWATL